MNFITGSRVSGSEGRKIEPFHDQVRSTVLKSLSDNIRKARHRRLAEVLKTDHSVEPQFLVTHFRESGDFEAAYIAAIAAGKLAENQLAFERAAVFYGIALDLADHGVPDSFELYTKLADCLGRAGRGRDSAVAYMNAAELCGYEESLEMQRLASDQFLRSGYIEQGMCLFEALARQFGIKVVSTPLGALIRIALLRLRTRARLFFFPTKPSSRPISRNRLSKLQILHIGGVTLDIVDPVAAAYFQVRYVSEVLRYGDRRHLAIGLALESGIRAATGVRNAKNCLMRLENAQNMAAEVGDSNVEGFVRLCRAYVDYLLMRVPEGIRSSQIAIEFLRTQCTGVSWEVTAAYVLSFWFKCWAGEVAEVRSLLPQLLKEGAARGDVNVGHR